MCLQGDFFFPTSPCSSVSFIFLRVTHRTRPVTGEGEEAREKKWRFLFLYIYVFFSFLKEGKRVLQGNKSSNQWLEMAREPERAQTGWIINREGTEALSNISSCHEHITGFHQQRQHHAQTHCQTEAAAPEIQSKGVWGWCGENAVKPHCKRQSWDTVEDY